MNSTLRLSALIAATALLAACGGGGGGGSTPGPTTPPPSGGLPDPGTNPDPGPTNPPVNDAEKYKGFLGSSLGIVLGIDHVSKTLYDLPAKIEADVEQHGPSAPPCSHSACPPEEDTSDWVTFPVDNGTVRLQEWTEIITKDGQLGGDEHLALDVVGLGHPTITSTIDLFTPGERGEMGLSFRANYELTREGLLLNDDPSTVYHGNLYIKETEGRLEIYDHPPEDELNTRQLTITEVEGEGKNEWMTNYYAATNKFDRDAVTFDIDMFNFNGGGQRKLKSETPLNFGELNGRMVLESGSFIYDNLMGETHVILRTSVDADPAFLKVEIDENGDGTYDTEGRIAQEDFNFNFNF